MGRRKLTPTPEPPWIFLGFLAATQIAAVLLGAPTLSGLIRASGLLFVAAGLVLHYRAGVQFRQAQTTQATLAEPTGLVTEGVFGLTRNPMYLGGVLILVGWALLQGHASLLLTAPLFGLTAELLWIRPEERLLSEVFGDEYGAYRKRTRRWI